VLGDGDPDGHVVPTAAHRLPAAVVTPPTAVTTPDTVLRLGWDARFDAAVWSFASADFRAVVCACHWPFACAVKAVSFVLTLATPDLIWFAEPFPTLMWVRLLTEERRAAASAHSAALPPGVGDDAAAEAGEDTAAEVAGALVALDEPLPEPQATRSSPAPSAIAATLKAGPVSVIRLMFLSMAFRGPRDLTLGGLSQRTGHPVRLAQRMHIHVLGMSRQHHDHQGRIRALGGSGPPCRCGVH